MNRSTQILSVFLLLTLVSVATAQTPATCGIVGIEGPATVDPDVPLVLKVRTTGILHTTKPEFKWKVSVGTITEGQGTDQVTIDTTGLGGLRMIVTTELSGATAACNGSASARTEVDVPPVTCSSPKFDAYGDIKFKVEKARLDNFAIQLLNDPLSSGYILAIAGQETFPNEATDRLDRAKTYLVNVREIDPNRVITLDCGFTEDLTVQLFVAPLGSSPPPCSIFNEIPFSEVKFTKPRPEASKKPR